MRVKVRHVVLVVVLLLVALAVATLSAFQMGGGGLEDDARARMASLHIYAKVYSKRHDDERVEDLADLAAYSEEGERGITDPWGKRFQFRYIVEPKSGKDQFVVLTSARPAER